MLMIFDEEQDTQSLFTPFVQHTPINTVDWSINTKEFDRDFLEYEMSEMRSQVKTGAGGYFSIIVRVYYMIDDKRSQVQVAISRPYKFGLTKRYIKYANDI